MKKGDSKSKKKEKEENHSEYEEFLHPNAMRDSEYKSDGARGEPMTRSMYARERQKKLNSCKSCFKRFDDLIMRPFLIYNYDIELISKKEEFLELFMKEGDVWEKMYMKEQYEPEAIDDVRTQRGHSLFLHIEN